MIVGESVMVALAGSVLAVGPAMLGGHALLDVFKDGGQVADGVDHVFGPIALMSGVAVTLLASAGAAFLAVRRATRNAAGMRQGRGRARKFAAWGALAVGAAGVLSTFAMKATDAALMAAPAYGAILLSVGFALLSPALLRALLDRAEPLLTALTGASGYLTVRNMRQRAEQLSGVLMPLILFTGMATTTLCMQAAENDAIKSSGLAESVEDKNLETLNFVVVGIIVVFACVMLVNTLYAATSYRVREFGQQRLAGATPGQVLGTVAVEPRAHGDGCVLRHGRGPRGNRALHHRPHRLDPARPGPRDLAHGRGVGGHGDVRDQSGHGPQDPARQGRGRRRDRRLTPDPPARHGPRPPPRRRRTVSLLG